MDFTLKVYRDLLLHFLENQYVFSTFGNYINLLTDLNNLTSKLIILRHDVDRRPKNALKMAQMEHELGIKSSYYFRIVKESNNPEIIKEIVRLGHEIGYHYEDLALAGGDYKKAIQSFRKNLEYFRQFYPVKTICMHGSPLSKYDNRDLWKKYSYKNFGIIGEPYFDIDFNEVLYLTDTGRRWDGASVSVRDKVNSGFNYGFKATDDIISALKNNELPPQVMLNIHPHRWNDGFIAWAGELVIQNIKNIGKHILAKRNQGRSGLSYS